jgi:hypothetical protein
MAHPLDPHKAKSPLAIMQAVNAQAGSVILDKWSVLDPTRAEKQLNAYSGLNAFRKLSPLDRGITDPHWSPDGLAAACGLVTG